MSAIESVGSHLVRLLPRAGGSTLHRLEQGLGNWPS